MNDKKVQKNDTVWIGLHIPKTGGQTFRQHLAKYYKLHSEFIQLGPFGREDAKKKGLPPFEEYSLQERNQCKIVFGHYVTDRTIKLLPGKSPIYFTCLRSPAKFYVSFYNFYMNYLSSRKRYKCYDSFENYYKAYGVNRISRAICNHFPSFCSHANNLYEKTSAVLNKFNYVLLTEYMDEQMVPLLQDLNVPTVMERKNVARKTAPNFLELDPELEERLNQENDVDFRIYSEYCSKLIGFKFNN